MTSIIIPVHNQHEMTKACVESIQAHTNRYEIIIVDNGSAPGIIWQDIEIGNDDIIFSNAENLGFPKAVNQGIKMAHGDVIVVMNNDVIVTEGWLDILRGHMDKFDMVGPCTNSVSGPQQVLIDNYKTLDEMHRAAASNREKNEGKSFPYHRLVFFCVAIKREVVDTIGSLDEIYTPGNFEDDDYCMSAIASGFKLGIARDCFVHHFGGVTHKALSIDYQKLLSRNQKIFHDKWSGGYKELAKKNNG
jgi:GT2 family glycosyltransferase